MNALDIKKIAQFVTGENEPNEIDINNLFFLLVLTSQKLTFPEKIFEIVSFIIFEQAEQGSPAQVTFEELMYIFQIGYQLFARVTNPGYPGPTSQFSSKLEKLFNQIRDQDQDFGCQSETDIVEGLFGKNVANRPEKVDLAAVIFKMQNNNQIEKFVQIFQYGRVLEIDFENQKESPNQVQKQVQKIIQKQVFQKVEQQIQSDKYESNNQSKLERQGTQAKDKSTLDVIGSNLVVSKKTTSGDLNGQDESGVQTSPKDEKADGNLYNNKVKIQIRINTEKKVNEGQQENVLQQSPDESISMQTYCPQDFSSQFNFTKRSKKDYNNQIYLKMQEKLIKIQDQNQKDQNQYFYGETLQKLKVNFQKFLVKNMDFYAQRQMLQVMQSKNNFNYYKWDQAAYYRLETARAKLNKIQSIKSPGLGQVLFKRGVKRVLEQKKFKLIGQIQMLEQIFKLMVINNWDLLILKDDTFYRNIYASIHQIYKTKIDHIFIVDAIAIKNKKREIKRFQQFLEGAKQILDEINENLKVNKDQKDNQNYPEALRMVSNHLTMIKQNKLIKIQKQSAELKVNFMTHFQNIGKLKSLYLIFFEAKKWNHDNITIAHLSLKNLITARVEKSRLKLENIDIQLVNLVSKRINKSQVVNEYFQALGEVAVLKCQNKCIDFSNIYHYFTLDIIQQRTQEAIQLYLSQDQQENGIQKFTAADFEALHKLQKTKYIDKLFNVGATESVGSINYIKYQDELGAIVSSCNSTQEVAQEFTPLEIPEEEIQINNQSFDFFSNVSQQILNSLYDQIDVSNLFQKIKGLFDDKILNQQYFQENLLTQIQPSFDLISQDYNYLNNFIMDLVPFTDREEPNKMENPYTYYPDQYDQKIMEYLNENSTSFQFIYQDEVRKERNEALKISYKINSQYYTELQNFEEAEHDELFKKTRDKVFMSGMQALMKINKTGYLNGFELKHLSLPLERSIQNNYWAYQTIKIFLSQQKTNKILGDINKIAAINEIFLNSFQNKNNADQEKGSQFERQPQKKIEQPELVKVLKKHQNEWQTQSFLKPLINQLQKQFQILNLQEFSLTQCLNKLTDSRNRMDKIGQYLRQGIAILGDENCMSTMHEEYFFDFLKHSKISSSLQLQIIMKGAQKYVNLLKNEVQKGKNENHQNLNYDNLASLLVNLQNKFQQLQPKFEQKHQKLLKDLKFVNKNEQQINAKILSQKYAATSSTNYLPVHDEPTSELQSQMLFKENEIIESTIQLQNLQNILMIHKQFENNHEEFRQKLDDFLQSVIEAKQKVDQLIKYLKQTVDTKDDQSKYQYKGAKLINDVLAFNCQRQIILPDLSVQQTPKREKTNILIEFRKQETEHFQDQAETLFLSQSRDELESAQYDQDIFGYLNSNLNTIRSPVQKLNFFTVTFLELICNQEDIINSKKAIKDSNLFEFANQTFFETKLIKNTLSEQVSEKQALFSNIISINEILSSNINKYLSSYQSLAKFIQNDLFHKFMINNSHLIKSQFILLISKMAPQLEKYFTNKIDGIFCMVKLDEEERKEFTDFQTQIRKKRAGDLRQFRLSLEGAANKQLSGEYETCEHLLMVKLEHSITAMKLVVRIYYLKQVQLWENELEIAAQQTPLEIEQKTEEDINKNNSTSSDSQVRLYEIQQETYSFAASVDQTKNVVFANEST